MLKQKWLVVALVLMMALALVAGCGTQTGGDTTGDDASGDAAAVVKVGFMGPITGANAAEGSAARNAFQMAFDQLNASGELSYTVEVVAMDDASKPETGASAAQKLTAEEGMVAISGHWNSPVAEATIPICKQAEIPLVIWGAIRETLTSADNYPIVTRVCPTEVQENSPIAKAVLGDMGYKKIYIVSDVTSYGEGNTAAFTKEIENYGAELVGVEKIQTGTTDFRPILAKIKQTDAEAIYFGGVVQEAGLCKRQMADAGMNDLLFFGISGISSEDFFTAAGDAAEGTFSIKPGVDPNKTEVGKAFLESYAAANFDVPVGAFTPYAYDAAQVIIAALKSVDGVPTAAQMTDAIANVQAEGLLGTTTFDEIGQTTNPAAYALVAQDGAWVPWVDSEYAAGTRSLPKK